MLIFFINQSIQSSYSNLILKIKYSFVLKAFYLKLHFLNILKLFYILNLFYLLDHFYILNLFYIFIFLFQFSFFCLSAASFIFMKLCTWPITLGYNFNNIKVLLCFFIVIFPSPAVNYLATLHFFIFNSQFYKFNSFIAPSCSDITS